MARKPAIVNAIGYLFLAGGIWAIGHSLVAAAACCFLWPLELVVGVVAVFHAGNILAESQTPPSRFVSVLMILCILNFDPITMVFGIITYIYSGHSNLRGYYAAQGIEY